MGKAEQVYAYTERKIEYLESISDTPLGRGMMANIRHGIGRAPGELPELWGLIFDGMPEELLGHKKASYAEWSIYTALTLYALHQQSKEKTMYAKNISFGQAAAQLIKDDDDMERILRRINLVTTALSPSDVAYHLRSMIQLFKSEDIAFDHARLAKDIYLFSYPEYASNVKLSWGRDFYRERYKVNKNREGE